MAAKKLSGLGRGIDAIFLENTVETPAGGGVMTLRTAQIEPKGDQPRKFFDTEALAQLADSISAHGVLQPILVREIGGERYQIIAGERRWRAAKMAGLSEIPAVVFDGDDMKAAEVSLIENIQREDLNPVEEAAGYGALIEKFDLTQDQVAKKVGKSRSAVANMLRLLDLPDEALEMLRIGEITAGHARALLGLDDEEEIMPLANRIVTQNLSVRETENSVKRINALANRKDEEAEEDKAHPQIKLHMKELERRAMSALGRKVRISRSSRKKVVELTYDNDEDLESLLRSLCGQTIFDE